MYIPIDANNYYKKRYFIGCIFDIYVYMDRWVKIVFDLNCDLIPFIYTHRRIVTAITVGILYNYIASILQVVRTYIWQNQLPDPAYTIIRKQQNQTVTNSNNS